MSSISRPLLFWVFTHLALWTLIPVLCTHCLPLDSVEAVMWGNAWQWGYDKHPPLSAWLAKLFFEAGGGGMTRGAGVYFLSQLCVVTAGIGIYKIARLHGMSAIRATFTVITLELIYYYQYITPEFNANIIQLPFWAWGWYWGMKAVREKRLSYWILLGLTIGVGALSKYLAVWFLIPLFAYWWRRGELLKVLKKPGLYVAAGVSILVFLPHLIWMVEHDFMTLTYGFKRAEGEEANLITKHLWYPTEYLLSQLGILLPALFVFWIGRRKSGATAHTYSEENKGLDGLAWGGLVFLFGLSLLFGVRPVTMWASPMPLAIGLWGVARFRIQESSKSIPRGAFIMGALGLLTFIVVYGLAPFYKGKPEKLNYPAIQIATLAKDLWNEQTDNAPLNYVIGKEWIGGILSAYDDERPLLMIRADLQRSPYITDADVHRDGAIVIWEKSRKAHDGEGTTLSEIYPDLKSRFPETQVQKDLIIDWPNWKDGLQGRFGLAIIPPKGEEDARH